jgi:hypothetical protein
MWAVESSTNVSLNPFYYLDLMLQAITSALNPLMPTTGLLAQSTEKYLIMVSLAHFALKLFPSIGLAWVVYSLIPKDFNNYQK